MPKAASPRSKPRRRRAPETLEAELNGLKDLSKEALKARWDELYDAPCPPYISRKLLTYAVAYRIQERALGGLDRATQRRLDRAAEALAQGKPIAAARRRIKPGTKLLREWQGTLHEVIVLEKGVSYGGKTWPSLSAVAREITGARWSGPRFFGLNGGHRGEG